MEAGQQVVSTENLNHLAVKAGRPSLPQEDIRGHERRDARGQLLRFESEMRMGPSPSARVGQVHGDRLDMETSGATRRTADAQFDRLVARLDAGRWPWSRRLWQQPMQPGEHRTLKTLMIGFNQVADGGNGGQGFRAYRAC